MSEQLFNPDQSRTGTASDNGGGDTSPVQQEVVTQLTPEESHTARTRKLGGVNLGSADHTSPLTDPEDVPPTWQQLSHVPNPDDERPIGG